VLHPSAAVGDSGVVCAGSVSDLASSATYPKVKRAAEDREGWRATKRRGMPYTCYIAKY